MPTWTREESRRNQDSPEESKYEHTNTIGNLIPEADMILIHVTFLRDKTLVQDYKKKIYHGHVRT